MEHLNIPLVLEEHFPKDLQDMLQSVLQFFVPKANVTSYCLTPCRKEVSKWFSKYIEDMSHHTLILQGPLTRASQECVGFPHLLHRCLSAHTRVHKLSSVGSRRGAHLPFKFVLVEECSSSFDETPSSPVLSSASALTFVDHQATAHVACLLAMAHSATPCIHYVFHTSDEPLLQSLKSMLSAYSKIRLHEIPLKEAVGYMMDHSHLLQVVCAAPIAADVLRTVLMGVHGQGMGYSSVSIGPKTVLFDIASCTGHQTSPVYGLLALGMVLRYLSYRSSAILIENFLEGLSEQDIERSPSWFAQSLLSLVETPPEPDETYIWRAFNRRYHENTQDKITVVGFDVLLTVPGSAQELGESLEDLTGGTPFYLQGIVDGGVPVYPMSLYTLPSYTPVCCRFLVRPSEESLTSPAIGKFLDQLSVLYPWLEVSHLYHLGEKTNFRGFPALG